MMLRNANLGLALLLELSMLLALSLWRTRRRD